MDRRSGSVEVGRQLSESFIGPAAAGVWRDRFAPADRQAFDAVAGELLVQLGYEPDHAWAKGVAWTPLPGRR